MLVHYTIVGYNLVQNLDQFSEVESPNSIVPPILTLRAKLNDQEKANTGRVQTIKTYVSANFKKEQFGQNNLDISNGHFRQNIH